MKGRTSHFESPYNGAESGDVKTVVETNDYDATDHKQVPSTGKPNSVTRVYKNGKLIQERYYDDDGDAYLDIDYTDHNRPDKHPVVPHQHKWKKNVKVKNIAMNNIDREAIDIAMAYPSSTSIPLSNTPSKFSDFYFENVIINEANTPTCSRYFNGDINIKIKNNLIL